MTLDELMNQYGNWGLHDLDIDLVVPDENGVTVYASFTEMSDDGKPVCEHGLIVKANSRCYRMNISRAKKTFQLIAPTSKNNLTAPTA